jgi:hypothetical protein
MIALTTVSNASAQQNCLQVIGTFTLTDSYTTGGEDVATALKNDLVKSSGPPFALVATGVTGYIFQYNAVTGKLMIFSSTTAQLAQASYPAGLTTSNPVTFIAWLPKLI